MVKLNNLKISDSFLVEEFRSGYLVTAQRKQLWAVELDLLSEFDRVCKKHNLRWCAGAGTLLGAVRHHGFIPWDDDIDLYMFREDYDKLFSLSNEFKYPYFLQNSKTEKNFLSSYSKLRNCETVGATSWEKSMNINKGIFLDICPLDGITNDLIANKIQEIKNNYYIKAMRSYTVSRNPQKIAHDEHKMRVAIQILLGHLLVHKPARLYEKYKRNATMFSNELSTMWGNRSINFDCPKSRREREDYENLIEMPFEMLTVPVPRNYDSMLRQQYGDYMAIPQNKDGGKMHGKLIISTNYAYDDPRRLKEE